MRLMSYALATAVTVVAMSFAQADGEGDDVEAWRSSPFHGQRDSGTGLPIPCKCRFDGRDFRVGDRVCMTTPQAGVVIARCDLVNNITSWVATKSACTLS